MKNKKQYDKTNKDVNIPRNNEKNIVVSQPKLLAQALITNTLYKMKEYEENIGWLEEKLPLCCIDLIGNIFGP